MQSSSNDSQEAEKGETGHDNNDVCYTTNARQPQYQIKLPFPGTGIDFPFFIPTGPTFQNREEVNSGTYHLVQGW